MYNQKQNTHKHQGAIQKVIYFYQSMRRALIASRNDGGAGVAEAEAEAEAEAIVASNKLLTTV